MIVLQNSSNGKHSTLYYFRNFASLKKVVTFFNSYNCLSKIEVKYKLNYLLPKKLEYQLSSRKPFKTINTQTGPFKMTQAQYDEMQKETHLKYQKEINDLTQTIFFEEVNNKKVKFLNFSTKNCSIQVYDFNFNLDNLKKHKINTSNLVWLVFYVNGQYFVSLANKNETI